MSQNISHIFLRGESILVDTWINQTFTNNGVDDMYVSLIMNIMQILIFHQIQTPILDMALVIPVSMQVFTLEHDICHTCVNSGVNMCKFRCSPLNMALVITVSV